MTDVKEILYIKLVETIKRMRSEDKFNGYHYKFNPALIRGNETVDEHENGWSTKNTSYERSSCSYGKNGNEIYFSKTFDINFHVFNDSAYIGFMNHVVHSWSFSIRIDFHRTPEGNNLNVCLTSKSQQLSFVFPIETYVNQGMSIEGILKKFEDEFMEVPPCVLQQRVIDGNTEYVEFMRATDEQLETMYQGIERFYDEEFEKRKLLVHTLKDIPTELLKEYIFKHEQPISIENIPHLRLNSI
jgi:hypothetical protein